jgi:hypothetical protein
MRSPAFVFAENPRDKVLVDPLAAFFATWTNATEAGDAIVKVSVALPVPVELAALKVTVEVAAVVGVPEINPVPVFTDRPAGKPVAA